MSISRTDFRRSLLLPVAVPSPYPGHAASRGTPSSDTARLTPSYLVPVAPSSRRVTPVPKDDSYSANMYSSGYASETSSEHESLCELPVDRVEWEAKRGKRDSPSFDSETLSIREFIYRPLAFLVRVFSPMWSGRDPVREENQFLPLVGATSQVR
uniref:Uncharacterized protein n=1 Tax=Pristionchus pacificus TaxID=54126 RepID=A0A2A6C9E7_PRIPA|eukprot:PDM74710.1 hypothetical protein PRIPAC_43661 [Pristionchus pacificus]